jgi:pilus assembly protein CpaB
MRSRSLVVTVALLAAIGATAAVLLYVNNVRKDAVTGGDVVDVIVATQDVPAGTQLDPLVDAGSFAREQVPSDVVVQGAVTDVQQLQGRTTREAILAGEQIPASRLSGSEEQLPGGTLGLAQGFEAVSVNLQAEQLVAEALQAGDHVTAIAHFKFGAPDAGVTAVIVRDSRVLGVTTPDERTQDPSSSSQNRVVESQNVTLELSPVDVQKLVYGQNEGEVWLALIRPGDEPRKLGPMTFKGVMHR